MKSALEGVGHLERSFRLSPLRRRPSARLRSMAHCSPPSSPTASSAGSSSTICGAIRSRRGHAGQSGQQRHSLAQQSAMNKNVLSTETPSPAPAPPATQGKATGRRNGDSHPRKTGKTKAADHAKNPATPAPPFRTTWPATASRTALRSPGGTSRQMASNGPTAVGDNDFASRFGCVRGSDQRQDGRQLRTSRKSILAPAQSTRLSGLQTRPRWRPGNMQLDRSSGSPHARSRLPARVQRVDTSEPFHRHIIKVR